MAVFIQDITSRFNGPSSKRCGIKAKEIQKALLK